MPQDRALPYRPALDGLRGLAVSAVLLFHAGHLSGGFLGVDLFFTLSGYLITTLLLDEHAATSHIRLGAFWERRARRLYPALVLMMIVTFAAIGVLHGIEAISQNREEALAGVFYASNWYAMVTDAPFLSVFQHLWSLAIEAQFYVAWPVIVIAVLHGVSPGDKRSAALRVLLASVVGVAISAALMIALYRDNDSLARVYFGTDTRATPILFGAALACYLATRPEKLAQSSRRVFDLSGWVVLAATIGFWGFETRTDASLYHGDYLVVICASLALLVAVALEGGSCTKALSAAPLRLLGLISYGVYLWHWPVFYLLNAERLHLTSWPLFAVQCAITLALATASYRVVELPIRARGSRRTSRAPNTTSLPQN